MTTPHPLDRLRPGMRAVVRHRSPDGLTDSVGEIEALDADTVTVRSRRGREVIGVSDVTLAKEVPPRPSRRGAPHRAISIDDLQRVMAAGWPAVEQERLGDWLLRASSGYTRRANSVLPLGDPGVELAQAVDRAQRWYVDRGLPCRWSLAGPLGFADTDDPLGELLLTRGYRSEAPTLVLTAPTTPLRTGAAQPSDGPAGVEVRSRPTPPEAWWLLGDVRAGTSAQAKAAAAQILVGAPGQVFLEARQDDAPVAVARVAFAHVWAGITGLAVDPRHRRQGLATRLVSEAAREAREREVRSIHLQVEPDNEAALALYERLGFTPHHEYRYLVR